MEPAEILKHMSDGANFYLRKLGDAQHMEVTENRIFIQSSVRKAE